MYELKKMELYLQVNLLGPGPRLMKKEFTGPRSQKVWEKTDLDGAARSLHFANLDVLLFFLKLCNVTTKK